VKRMFGHYEWLGPLLLTPAAGWLWLQASGGNWAVMLVALTIPVLHGYVVPAIGTNLLKVWSFSTRVRIGNFRPQHGFVFGSATAAIVALLFLVLGNDAPALVRAGATGGVLLAINWAYDALAIHHGVLLVRNQPWANGAAPWVIAADYVIWFFGLFGLVYGALVDAALRSLAPDAPWATTLGWIAGGTLLTMLLPTLCYIAASQLRHGHSGCRPVLGQTGHG
jgi:hypothetical protein